MSENSKKILENRKKKIETQQISASSSKLSVFTPSPQNIKVIQAKKFQSNSSKTLLSKTLFENNAKSINNEPIIIPQTTTRDNPSIMKSEKVLSAKFIKEFNKKFDDVSQGKTSLDLENTKYVFQDMYFLNVEADLLRLEMEDRLFKKF